MPSEQAPPSEAARARMQSGQKIGELAKSIFPEGVTAQVVGGTNDKAVAKTQQLIESGAPVIFESTFMAGDMLARTDILVREEDGWHLIEVKSSSRYKREDHLADVAYQVFVLGRAGVKVVRSSVMHLNTAYVWPGGDHDISSLFEVTEITGEVDTALQQVGVEASLFLALWDSTDYPSPTGEHPHLDPGIRPACRSCSFSTHCFDRAPKDHIFYLNLHHTRVKKLKDRGITLIRDIPTGFITDGKEQLRWFAAVRQKPQIDHAIRDRLSAIQYPAHLIDFEAARPDIPIIPGTSPYELVPFQWSCHTLIGPPVTDLVGVDHTHSEFLCTDRVDPREEFARTLYENIRDGGSVLHYHVYEKTVIKDLAEKDIPYAEELVGMFDSRFVDLEKIVAECYADSRFGGLTSIKAVLPVIAPELSYDALTIHNGDQAQAEFIRAFGSSCSDEDRAKVFDALRAYCKLDTWAMVRLLRGLHVAAA